VKFRFASVRLSEHQIGLVGRAINSSLLTMVVGSPEVKPTSTVGCQVCSPGLVENWRHQALAEPGAGNKQVLFVPVRSFRSE